MHGMGRQIPGLVCENAVENSESAEDVTPK